LLRHVRVEFDPRPEPPEEIRCNCEIAGVRPFVALGADAGVYTEDLRMTMIAARVSLDGSAQYAGN
jgi:hypothetical protein